MDISLKGGVTGIDISLGFRHRHCGVVFPNVNVISGVKRNIVIARRGIDAVGGFA